MGNPRQDVTYDYRNDFISLSIHPLPEQGQAAFLFCFSINLTRFFALCQGHFGICSNPAFKGLQLLRAEVCAFAIEKGARPKEAGAHACAGVYPRGQGWYHESLLIENVPESFLPELLQFGVMSLIKKVLIVCIPDIELPEAFPDPAALQAYIESL